MLATQNQNGCGNDEHAGDTAQPMKDPATRATALVECRLARETRKTGRKLALAAPRALESAKVPRAILSLSLLRDARGGRDVGPESASSAEDQRVLPRGSAGERRGAFTDFRPEQRHGGERERDEPKSGDANYEERLCEDRFPIDCRSH